MLGPHQILVGPLHERRNEAAPHMEVLMEYYSSDQVRWGVSEMKTQAELFADERKCQTCNFPAWAGQHSFPCKDGENCSGISSHHPFEPTVPPTGEKVLYMPERIVGTVSLTEQELMDLLELIKDRIKDTDREDPVLIERLEYLALRMEG